MPVKPIPDGYHAITPYLVCNGAPKLIEFLKAAFGAVEQFRMAEPSGRVAHCEIRIGDSLLMIAEATEQHPAAPTMLYHYVTDIDAVYNRAIKAGGESIKPPADQFYGDRNAMLKDPSGNTWGIATHVEDISSDEMTKRAATQSEK